MQQRPIVAGSNCGQPAKSRKDANLVGGTGSPRVRRRDGCWSYFGSALKAKLTP
jgi:hypothetical protein